MKQRVHDGRVLPKGVYFKHNSYYRVVDNQWIRLGADPSCLEWAHYALPTHVRPERREILTFAQGLVAKARQNHKNRNRLAEFTLTKEDVHRLLNESGWRCAVTGAEFSLEKVNGARPFAPSIDRRDAAKGYTPENCRIVCVATNLAMNVWGEPVLWRLFSKRQRVLDGQASLEDSGT